MTTNRTLYALALAALAIPVALTQPALAAGSHQGGHGHIEFGEPGKASDVSRTIEIVMGDMYFEPAEIEIISGETVRLRVRNEGNVVHEFNIGTPHMHDERQAEMQMMVDHGVIVGDRIDRAKMKMDMGNGKTMERKDPNSVLLEPGDSTEIVWKFTKTKGLEFACNVPGHYDAGMAGMFSFVTKLASD